jgi:hypothetical protein
MPYILRGNLWGYICRECPRPLWGVIVRVYTAEDANLVERAVANPKSTAASLDERAVKARAGRLLAEATVGEDGSFEIAFDKKSGYQGGAVEVDLRMEGVPRIDERTATMPPRQVQLTTLQPAWRERGDDRIAYWEYYLAPRVWCRFLSWFGIWTICGRVTVCKTGYPVGGVRVRAYDVDWLQDDPLGAAVTDSTGRFQIYYQSVDFQQGTWADIELTGGPDLYFRVETLSAVPLLVEPSSRGRSPDRENVGNCFCVDLCLEEQPPTEEPPPVFYAVGGYEFATAIDGAPGGTGLTVGDHRAFYLGLRLNGTLPKKLNGNAMEYRFEWRTTNATGNAPGPWTTVAKAQIAGTMIGHIHIYAPTSATDPNPIKTTPYFLGDTDYTADGFIRVPQQHNTFGVDGFFQPNGNMIVLDSRTLAAFGSIDMGSVLAGSSAAPLGANRHFSLRMMVREEGNSGSGAPAGVLEHIAIENTGYDNVHHHPSWAGFDDGPGVIAVRLLDIQELIPAGCAKITNQLHVLVTAAHPNLGAVSLSVIGNAFSGSFTLPAAVPGQLFGTATNNFNVATMPPCAYLVTLSAQILLTTGDSWPDTLFDQIAFAKA